MRVDIMTALKELNPSFLRLPGGNNLEGSSNGGERSGQILLVTSRRGLAGREPGDTIILMTSAWLNICRLANFIKYPGVMLNSLSSVNILIWSHCWHSFRGFVWMGLSSASLISSSHYRCNERAGIPQGLLFNNLWPATYRIGVHRAVYNQPYEGICNPPIERCI